MNEIDIEKLESGKFFTREHLETYTKKQLIEIMLMMPAAINALINAMRQERSKSSWIDRLIGRGR